jgi:hypothetical protein
MNLPHRSDRDDEDRGGGGEREIEAELAVLAQREEGFLRPVARGGEPVGAEPIQARKATRAMCRRVSVLKGSRGTRI